MFNLLNKTRTKETIDDRILLLVSVSQDNDKQPNAANLFFQSIHGTLKNLPKAQDHFSFEIIGNSSGIYFVIVCTRRYMHFIESQVYASYPDVHIQSIQEYTSVLFTPDSVQSSLELTLKREYFLPIRTFDHFEVDPIGSIISSMSKLAEEQHIFLQIVARPINNTWQEDGKKYIKKISKEFTQDGIYKNRQLEAEEKSEIQNIIRKSTFPGFQFVIRIITVANETVAANGFIEDMQSTFHQFDTVHLNGLAPRKKNHGFLARIFNISDNMPIKEKFVSRFLSENEPAIINTDELASIYHLPNKSVKTPKIAWSGSKKLDFPKNLPKLPHNTNVYELPLELRNNTRYFGYTDYRNTNFPFGIKREDRRRHMYLLGKTGTGKSLFIQNMVYGDLVEGEGAAVIDPHGDLIENILSFMPQNRVQDVVYLDPSDTNFPVGLNMLDVKPGEEKELLADGILSVFIKLFGHSWGPRLQHILHNTILTLLHCQNVSLLAVQRILMDENYRRFLLKQVKDPFLVRFWEEEFFEMSKNKRLLSEAIAPINNKVGRFLSSPLVRNMIGQIKSSIDLQEIMDSGKILLVNLSQGKIGEENTSLLGGMLVTRLYTNAMQRARIPEGQRRDFYLYVDEFQNFATSTFIKILSEARKYGLNLLVTHQYMDQIDPTIQNALLGNVGTIINYVVGPKDASRLESEYNPYLNANDLVNLSKFNFVTKLTINGTQSPPFSGRLMLPNYAQTGLKELIKQTSRENYSLKRELVEQKLSKWALQKYNDKGNLVQ